MRDHGSVGGRAVDAPSCVLEDAEDVPAVSPLLDAAPLDAVVSGGVIQRPAAAVEVGGTTGAPGLPAEGSSSGWDPPCHRPSFTTDSRLSPLEAAQDTLRVRTE